jgi:hypothetical protein
MSTFAGILAGKVETYIELRHSLGYSFKKQAGTLRAFARYVESEQLDGPLTRRIALGFVLSFDGAPNAGPRVTACFAAFANISPSTMRGPKASTAELSPGHAPFHRRAS